MKGVDCCEGRAGGRGEKFPTVCAKAPMWGPIFSFWRQVGNNGFYDLPSRRLMQLICMRLTTRGKKTLDFGQSYHNLESKPLLLTFPTIIIIYVGPQEIPLFFSHFPHSYGSDNARSYLSFLIDEGSIGDIHLYATNLRTETTRAHTHTYLCGIAYNPGH